MKKLFNFVYIRRICYNTPLIPACRQAGLLIAAEGGTPPQSVAHLPFL